MQGQRRWTQQNSNLLIKENEQTTDQIIVFDTKLNRANEQLNENATKKLATPREEWTSENVSRLYSHVDSF